MSRLSLVLLALFLGNSLLGQEITINAGANYGYYSFSSLKNFNNELFDQVTNEFGLQFEKIDEFPNFFSYGINAHLYQENQVYGLQIAQRSTGSRISYGDYSGKYNIDQSLESFDLLGKFGITLHEKGKLETLVLMKAGIALTSHEIKSDFQLYGTSQEQKESVKFVSTNLVIGLEINSNLSIYKGLFIFPSIGYDYHYSGKLKYKENQDFNLIDESGDDVTADWNGLRLGLGLGYRLFIEN